MSTDNPSIYVGTYAKYNNGSLFGKWLDLTEYSDCAEFYEACAELHKGESDPEFMFQDWENIPDQYISESGISQEYWDYLETIEGSYLDAEVFEAAADLDISVDMVEELYQGEYNSDSDFAYDMAEQLGYLDKDVSWPYTCIDWDYAARELMYDYGESSGHYFRTSY